MTVIGLGMIGEALGSCLGLFNHLLSHTSYPITSIVKECKY
jgi:hypothetical protein